MAIILLSSLPYIHDVITIRGEGLNTWVPDFGIINLLTDADGNILGFSTYRVFIYTLFIHIFAHIGWVGWFFDAKEKLYRPFLLIPVALSLYQIGIILSNSRNTNFNEPNVKIGITIFLAILLAVNFFLNNKVLKANFNQTVPQEKE